MRRKKYPTFKKAGMNNKEEAWTAKVGKKNRCSMLRRHSMQIKITGKNAQEDEKGNTEEDFFF